MNARQIALASTLLALALLGELAGRVLQIGGAQASPSVAILTLMALLLAQQIDWGPLAGIGLVAGILFMVASSSPFPAANVPAMMLAFLVAAWLARSWSPSGEELSTAQILTAVSVVSVLSWTVFAAVTWIGLAGTGFTQQSFDRYGVGFGQGLLAFWLFGFVGVVVPSWIIGLVVTPLLYRAVRPALVRQGLVPTVEAGA